MNTTRRTGRLRGTAIGLKNTTQTDQRCLPPVLHQQIQCDFEKFVKCFRPRPRGHRWRRSPPVRPPCVSSYQTASETGWPAPLTVPPFPKIRERPVKQEVAGERREAAAAGACRRPAPPTLAGSIQSWCKSWARRIRRRSPARVRTVWG